MCFGKIETFHTPNLNQKIKDVFFEKKCYKGGGIYRKGGINVYNYFCYLQAVGRFVLVLVVVDSDYFPGWRIRQFITPA